MLQSDSNIPLAFNVMPIIIVLLASDRTEKVVGRGAARPGGAREERNGNRLADIITSSVVGGSHLR